MGPPDDLSAAGPPPAGNPKSTAGDPTRAWVAPEAPPPGVAPSAAEPPTSGTDDAADPVVLPAPLRLMTVGDLLDGGFNVLRARPRTVLAMAAVFVVPVQLVTAFLNRNALEDFERLVDETLSTGSASTGAGSTAAALIGTIGGSIAQTLVAAGLAVLVTGWYAGGQPSLADVLRVVGRRAPALTAAWILIHLLEVAGLLTLGVGSVAAMVFYLVAAPAIAVEGLGPFAGMARASRLASRRFWTLLGFALLSGLVATTLGQVLGLLPQLLGLLLGPDLGWVALGVGSIITQLVATTVVGAATVLAYLDLRIRLEGLDLAWAADRHLPEHES